MSDLRDWLDVHIYNAEAAEPALSFGDTLAQVADELLALPLQERAMLVGIELTPTVPIYRDSGGQRQHFRSWTTPLTRFDEGAL